MSLEIVHGDIADMEVDALVEVSAAANARNGGHVEIARASGMTAPHVVRIVAPVWNGGRHGEKALLEECYGAVLRKAAEAACASIAFPLIRSNDLGFPDSFVFDVAMGQFQEYLRTADMRILLVAPPIEGSRASARALQVMRTFADDRASPPLMMPCAAPRVGTLPFSPVCYDSEYDELLGSLDAGFSETLLGLIDKSGKSDAEVYKKAHITRQHFSKIRNKPDYKPSKTTAVAFALALELDIEAARDLVERAGYSLTRSSAFDVLVTHFIKNKEYDIVELNQVLYAYDQPLLGSQ